MNWERIEDCKFVLQIVATQILCKLQSITVKFDRNLWESSQILENMVEVSTIIERKTENILRKIQNINFQMHKLNLEMKKTQFENAKT